MAEEICRAPDGTPMWTFGLTNQAKTMLWLLLIASVPLTSMLLGPKVVFKVGSTFGYYLRKKTAGRKAQILELVEADEKEFKEEQERSEDVV